MSVLPTEEQQSLAADLRRWIARESPLSTVRESVDSGSGRAPQVWQHLAHQLGLAGLAIPEEFGGAGGGWGDMAAALRELGAGLVPSPLVASGVLAAGALLESDDAVAKETWLPRIAEGSVVTLAVSESGHRTWLPSRPATRLEGDRVSGEKAAVLDGDQAEAFLVLARGDDGDRLVLVERGEGVTVTPHTSIDLTRDVTTVSFDSAPGLVLDGDPGPALERAHALGDIALAAEQVGAMAACIVMTTEYAKLRRSFGLPIGAYQGVKHKLADMYADWSIAEAAVRAATLVADGHPGDLALAAGTARTLASSSYLKAGRTTMLLHGGLGYTWEHDAHLYYRNAVAGAALLGDRLEQLDRLADALAG